MTKPVQSLIRNVSNHFSDSRRRNEDLNNIKLLKLDLANALTNNDHDRHMYSVTMMENRSIREQLEEMKKKCSKLEERNNELAEVVHHLKNNAKKASIEKAELRMQLEACQDQRDGFKNHLDPLKSDNLRLKSECEDLMAAVVIMRIELERMRNESSSGNNRTTMETSTDKANFEDDDLSTFTFGKQLSSRKSSVTSQNSDELEETQDEKQVDIKTVKNAAEAVKRWSEDTFGRRHSAIEYFFDDEILNHTYDEDGNTVISCLSDCSGIHPLEKNRRLSNNESNIQRDIRDVGLKSGKSFQTARALFNDQPCSDHYICQNKMHRFSFSNAMFSIQNRLTPDHRASIRIKSHKSKNKVY